VLDESNNIADAAVQRRFAGPGDGDMIDGRRIGFEKWSILQ